MPRFSSLFPPAVSFEADLVAGEPQSREDDAPPGLTRVDSSSTICTLAPGDSEAGSECEAGADDRSSGGAAASSSTGMPQLSARQERNTTPKSVTKKPCFSDVLNDRSDVGNIGWMFGNWGARARHAETQGHIVLQIKRGPAQVIGLTECEEMTQRMLEEPAVAADSNAPSDSLLRRPGFPYWTLRGEEDKSNLLAVRTTMVGPPELLLWDRVCEGQYKLKSGNEGRASSRYLICSIDFNNNVGFFGKRMVVAVVHLHHKVANHDKGFRKNQKDFWPKLFGLVQTFGIDVLMGDFNMSLFKVIPELRSRGVRIKLAAWFPWKTSGGKAMADSCGIFVINKPCVVSLSVGLNRLHSNDESGVLWESDEPYTDAVTPGNFSVFELHSGPGMSLATFLPKAADLVEKLKPSLEAADVSAVAGQSSSAVAGQSSTAVAGQRKERNERSHLKVKEKRLEAELWKYKGENHKGSHFPICAFTGNVGRRSDERFRARKERGEERRGRSWTKAWEPQREREASSWEKPQSRAWSNWRSDASWGWGSGGW